MYINTKRKVGNITFLELPNIKMEWKMEWNISGKNKTGHNIFPNPNLKNHDSYKGSGCTDNAIANWVVVYMMYLIVPMKMRRWSLKIKFTG